MDCPCHSLKKYKNCCKPFHDGYSVPKTPAELMRSRYAAYALKKLDYINQTCMKKRNIEELRSSFKSVLFENLDILETSEAKNQGTVTFRAGLKQNGKDISYTEKSEFIKIEGRWYYTHGHMIT